MIDEMVVVYYKDGSAGNVVASDEPKIERALATLVGEGEHRYSSDEERDSLVRLTALNGSRLVMRASAIAGYSCSSRENRRRRKLHEYQLDHENADIGAAPAKDGREAVSS